MSYTQEFTFSIEQYFGGLSGSGYSLGTTTFVVSKTFTGSEPFQAQTLPYVGGLMVGSTDSLALALPETMTSISGVQQKMSLDCPAPRKLNSAYDNWKYHPNVQFVEHGMGLALYVCVDDDHVGSGTWQSTGCYYPEIVWTGSYAATLKFYYDRRPCTVGLYTVQERAVVDDADSGAGHVEDDMGTKKLFRSETVKSGTSYALPGIDEMQEAVGGDMRVISSSGRVWKKSLDSSGGVFVASPLTVYGDMELYCCYTPSDDSKLVKFGTLKKMFGVFKEKSDAALDARFADLPSGGGVDETAMNAAIDAKLSTYTTERNAYVDDAIANAGYATDAEVAQAVEEGTSGLASTASVTGAVDAAKTELHGEMPKAYDFVSNANRNSSTFLSARNVMEDYVLSDAASYNDSIRVGLFRPNTTSPNTWGFLGVKKSDMDAEIAEKSPKPFDSTTNDQEGYIKGSQVYERADSTFKAGDIVGTCLWRTGGKEYLVVKKSAIKEIVDAAIEEQMAKVRAAVNGVVLYEIASLATSYARTVTLQESVFATYDRIEVTCCVTAVTSGDTALPRTAVLVFTRDECNLIPALGVYAIKAVTYVWDGDNLDEFFLSYVDIYDNGTTTQIGADNNSKQFRISHSGTNVVATEKPNGSPWVKITRVVGYKKLPEVS